jgi:uncharacterized protein
MMKWLALLFAALAGVWLWRRARAGNTDKTPARRGPARALPMVRCAHCGTHVPGDEAVAGRSGSYCSAGHRRESEGA